MKYLSIAIMFTAISIATVFEPMAGLGFIFAAVVGFFIAVNGDEK